MKKRVAAVLITTLGMTGLASSVPVENIAATIHNLSNYSDPARGGTNEICVFCHTPHYSNNSIGNAPLWNKPVSTSITFTVYGGGSTLANTTVGQPGDASRACLSCHDGVSGVNVVINAPGSGNINPSGVILDYRSSGTSSLWRMPDSFAIGKNYSTRATYDLSDDHPVGLEYIPGRAGLASKDKRIDTLGWIVSGDIDGNGYPSIGDLLRNGKVECTSCHNPHVNGVRFLRVDGGNSGSQLCLTCHEK
ncbi:MAG: cytochrome c3 family protein [Aquificae bacterium]|nr:cytochrome c3 family protein [Aquificota bacterium]